ncbi:hypothetical protein FI667_g8936, partial [Globisporangium splendens]
MGDRQVTYGLLWYLWQYAQERAIRKAAVESKAAPLVKTVDECQESVVRPPTQPSLSPKQSKSRNPEPTTTPPQRQPVRVSPILFDIPASALASGKKSGCQGSGGRSNDAVVREHLTAWKDEMLFQHDLFPQPSVLSPRGSSSESSSFILDDVQSASEPHMMSEMTRVQVLLTKTDELTTKETDVECKNEGEKTVICNGEDVVLDLAAESQETGANARETDATEEPHELDASSDHTAPKRSMNVVADSSVSSKGEKVAAEVEESDSYFGWPVVVKEKKPSQSQLSGEAISAQVVDETLRWLKQLNIRIVDPATFQTPRTPLLEFQSGVLLCGIVEKVEYMRCIQGICRKPNVSKATALHNISKALEILQQKKTMPLHLLRRKFEIYNGDRRIILELLQQIRKPNFVEKPQKVGDTLPK